MLTIQDNMKLSEPNNNLAMNSLIFHSRKITKGILLTKAYYAIEDYFNDTNMS